MVLIKATIKRENMINLQVDWRRLQRAYKSYEFISKLISSSATNNTLTKTTVVTICKIRGLHIFQTNFDRILAYTCIWYWGRKEHCKACLFVNKVHCIGHIWGWIRCLGMEDCTCQVVHIVHASSSCIPACSHIQLSDNRDRNMDHFRKCTIRCKEHTCEVFRCVDIFQWLG